MVQETLKARRRAALDELNKLIQDRKAFPINYNHYYTDNVQKTRGDRFKKQIEKHLPKQLHTSTQRCSQGDHYPRIDITKELASAVHLWADTATTDMELFGCEEALDCMLAIYKVSTFN